MQVNRATLLSDGLAAIESLESPHAAGETPPLRQQLRVHFEGEPGVDEGGLTSEFYTKLWEAVVAAPELFEDSDAHQSYLPRADAPPRQMRLVQAYTPPRPSAAACRVSLAVVLLRQ